MPDETVPPSPEPQPAHLTPPPRADELRTPDVEDASSSAPAAATQPEQAQPETAPRTSRAGATRDDGWLERVRNAARGGRAYGEGMAWPSLPFPWTAHMAVVTVLATMAFLMFVLIEPTPRWLLLVGAGAVLVGVDGTLRTTWCEPFASGADTVPYLFLPALYAFAAPILIEHNAAGFDALWWTLTAGLTFAAIVVAEVVSVRTGSSLYAYARLVTSAGAYFAAFTLFAMTYVLEAGLPAALIATWLIGTMLAIELLREGEVDPVETTVFAGVAGLVVAQACWLVYFLPIDGYLAGLALLLAFFLVIGFLHSHMTRQLTLIVALEYVAIAIVGLALVVGARAAGIA